MGFGEFLGNMLSGKRSGESLDPRTPANLEKIKGKMHEELLALARANAPDMSGDRAVIDSAQTASSGDLLSAGAETPSFNMARADLDARALGWLNTISEPKWLAEQRDALQNKIKRIDSMLSASKKTR